jgi:hypothetical protein
MRLPLPNFIHKMLGHAQTCESAPKSERTYRELSPEKLMKLRSKFDQKSWNETAAADKLAEQTVKV